MRQRVMIAMAMSCRPKLLLADEPTTALDVTIQAQILDLIDELKSKSRMAVMLITHDLGIVAQAAQRVAVMYTGEIVENAPVDALFDRPLHPYTQGLLDSIPGRDEDDTAGNTFYLKTIPGMVPDLYDLPRGCRFCDRCSFAFDLCREQVPQLREIEKDHFVACWKYSAGQTDPLNGEGDEANTG